MKKNFMVIVALAAVLFFAAPMTSEAADSEGTWKEGTQGWWYELSDGTYYANGFYEIEGKTYYFDAAGWMKTGWVKHVTNWYYFDQSGAMVEGWLNDGGTWYYLAEGGGWMYSEGTYTVDDTLYLFAKSGAWVGTPGWYELEYNSDNSAWFYLNGAGVVQTGWQLIGGEWYYMQDWGRMLEGGWYTIDEKEYLLDENGVWRHAQGWNKADGAWFYLDANGERQTGWLLDGGKWYYLEPSENAEYGHGQMYDGGRIYVAEDDAYYYFQYDGAMVAGWYNYGGAGSVYGDWVYCAANGTPHDGWLLSGGKWYYIDEGHMYTGKYIECSEHPDDYCYCDASVAYYLGDDGALVYGWYHDVHSDWDYQTTYSSSGWVYTNPNTGVMYTGWVLSSGKWYYIEDGWMVTGVARTMEYPEEPKRPVYPELQNLMEPVEADYDLDGTEGLSESEKAAYDADVQAYNEALQSDNAKLEAYYKACEDYEVAREKHEADYEAFKKSAYVFGADGAMVTGGWCAIKGSHYTTWMYANADGTAYDGWLLDGGKWYYIDYGRMVTNEYREGCWLGADGVWVK